MAVAATRLPGDCPSGCSPHHCPTPLAARLCVQVKFSLPFRVGLGEGWKIVGKCPELGGMTPEVAPYMTWTSGDVWTLEARMRPGKFVYKVRLGRAGGRGSGGVGSGPVLRCARHVRHRLANTVAPPRIVRRAAKPLRLCS